MTMDPPIPFGTSRDDMTKAGCAAPSHRAARGQDTRARQTMPGVHRAQPELVIRITGLRGTDRANRPPKRPKVVMSRHDHGNGGAGACCARSEAATAPAGSAVATPPRNRPIISSARTNRAIRAANRAEVMTSRGDHGSTAGGGWRANSETPPSAPAFMIPGRSQSLCLKDPRDHGSAVGGTASSP